MTSTASPRERLRVLAATATIGTDRFDSDDRAVDRLLTDAATSSIQARAGWRPQAHHARLPACPAEDRPYAPGPAQATLISLLSDPDAALIEEWAQLAHDHHVIVDGATVPLVLDWWSRQARGAQSIVSALGRRGEWLALLNPDWQKHLVPSEAPAHADELWQTSTNAERVAILKAVRRADPAHGLALVESTWQVDGATDRQRFLEVLFDERSMADEPFLEAALGDRSKVVRRQAAAVLARIKESRLRQRLSQAASATITVQTTRGILSVRSRQRVVLAPPESFDPSWERDGVEQRPPEGIGPRAWWMRQLIALADLSIWSERTGLQPDAILDSLKDDDYSADVVQALIAAAIANSDVEWSTALVRHLLAQASIDMTAIAPLVEGLPAESRESLTLEILSKAGLTTVDRWILVAASDRPWSKAFSTAAMKELSTGPFIGPPDFRTTRAIEAASRRIDPAAVEGFEAAVQASLSGVVTESAMNSIQRVRLRADMHKEFTL